MSPLARSTETTFHLLCALKEAFSQLEQASSYATKFVLFLTDGVAPRVYQ